MQGHAYLYYDVAHTQLLLHHIRQIKTIVNNIIEKIKKRDFNSKAQVDQINVLIELDMTMTEEYAKTQELFKQNGNLLSEASKLIHYLDSTTFNSDNMVKTMLEYHTMIKINKQMLNIKLNGDKLLWELKRKEKNSSKRRSITVGDGINNETFKITFSS
jgi:hypothetical protein